MPFYRCLIPKDSISYEKRSEIATAITDVHCGISAAPRNFVHVAFIETEEGESVPNLYGTATIEPGTRYFIAGGNRAGRPPEVRETILNGIIDKFCDITSISHDEISGIITEGPASWTMEDGQILPEPGEEPAEWYAHDAVAD